VLVFVLVHVLAAMPVFVVHVFVCMRASVFVFVVVMAGKQSLSTLTRPVASSCSAPLSPPMFAAALGSQADIGTELLVNGIMLPFVDDDTMLLPFNDDNTILLVSTATLE
jgi:hypothetical protein